MSGCLQELPTADKLAFSYSLAASSWLELTNPSYNKASQMSSHKELVYDFRLGWPSGPRKYPLSFRGTRPVPMSGRVQAIQRPAGQVC